MTQKDKQLLLKDLCARLPYGVKVDYFIDLLRTEKDDVTKELLGVIPSSENVMVGYDINNYEDSVIEDIKPYLRPMSSMTEEERKHFESMCCWGKWESGPIITLEAADWLNEHHFDYRGLIEKGLALEAPADMYKTQ